MILLLLLAAHATASYVTQTFNIGMYTTVVVYNASAPIAQFVLTSFNATTQTLYVAGLVDAGAVYEVVCEPVEVTPVLISPRGCDNANPALAVENSNCALDVAAADANLATLKTDWTLPWSEGYNYRFGPVIMVGLPPDAPAAHAPV